jgi:hypothetical protein
MNRAGLIVVVAALLLAVASTWIPAEAQVQVPHQAVYALRATIATLGHDWITASPA